MAVLWQNIIAQAWYTGEIISQQGCNDTSAASIQIPTSETTSHPSSVNCIHQISFLCLVFECEECKLLQQRHPMEGGITRNSRVTKETPQQCIHISD